MPRTISYLRVRPAERIIELAASTRRREGTTTLEIPGLSEGDAAAAVSGGILPVEVGDPAESAVPAAWVAVPAAALELSGAGIPGFRLTVADEGPREVVLDALARSQAAFLRTGRSRVADAADMARLPGLAATVSVFVDTVEDAVTAVGSGAGDLLLRDWGVEQLAALRVSLAPDTLVERTALPVGVDLDEVRAALPAPLFTAWLGQVDGSGAARPRYRWAPGLEEPLPVPGRRLSADWGDALWVESRPPEELNGAGDLAAILERSLDGMAPTQQEVEALFRARGDQVDAVARVADLLRQRTNGDRVTYVVNRNINYTNLCYFRCGFCAFSKGPRSLNLRGEPYLMGVEEIVQRAREAWDRGATEVCLQGGIHPDFTGDFYSDVVESIKAELPEIHIHGFTPLEVWQGAETLGVPVRQFLTRLRDAGLGTLPGTAAEVLDDRVRHHLCPDKVRTAEWAEVMITAHELGLRATSTLMFGHIDGPASWAEHYEVLRAIQRRTGGFTEFVPLPFVHMGAPIFLRGRSRPGPTWDEVVLVHAVARIAFDGLIPNIQASWVKLGLDGGARLLDAGCNDLGGTLMNEIITRSAGAAHGQEVTPSDFEAAILAAGRLPARRSTTYEILDEVSVPPTR
ncbi:MAG TPA: 5-amino-6-(D-ribitylamino)uracil--L-tyrosine 4-hydroxyphenyl transferase CofH [Acidimicrobiia bacterium]|nr:5-amino-6-(D-ribitylamino)uracil--L-tyrosine 4-hydroxyphenyl transferase CofH [Acidimicrobiia bacterium]